MYIESFQLPNPSTSTVSQNSANSNVVNVIFHHCLLWCKHNYLNKARGICIENYLISLFFATFNRPPAENHRQYQEKDRG
jgi:hypothetical protein